MATQGTHDADCSTLTTHQPVMHALSHVNIVCLWGLAGSKEADQPQKTHPCSACRFHCINHVCCTHGIQCSDDKLNGTFASHAGIQTDFSLPQCFPVLKQPPHELVCTSRLSLNTTACTKKPRSTSTEFSWTYAWQQPCPTDIKVTSTGLFNGQIVRRKPHPPCS